MKCYIGNGLKESLMAILFVTTIPVAFFTLSFIVGYIVPHYIYAPAISASGAIDYYLGVGTMTVVSITAIFFSGLGLYNLIYTLIYNPRSVLNFFIKCDESKPKKENHEEVIKEYDGSFYTYDGK